MEFKGNNFFQISLGDDFVKEFVMFSYDVPLSKHFVSRAYATFADRFKKILQVHPGYEQLTETDQVMISLLIAQIENRCL